MIGDTLVGIILLSIVFLLILLYSICRENILDDYRREKMSRTWEGEDEWEWMDE